MKSISSASFTLARAIAPSVLGLALCALSPYAQAQYSTSFDNLNSSLSLSGQDGWDSTDDSTGATYTYPGSTASNAARFIGQSDGVTSVATYRTGVNDQQAFVGGDNVNGGALPGSGTVFTYHPTGLPTTSNLAFNSDFVVTRPAVDANNNATDAHDQFGFSFLNTANTALFNINFQLAGNSSTTVDNVSYNVGGNPAAATPTSSLTLNSRYRLTVNVNVAASTFSASITAESLMGSTAGQTAQTVATNVPFTGSVGEFAAYWKLANLTTAAANGGTITAGGNNTAYTLAGSNLMLIDNVSSAVPEPSSYAMLGAGLLGLAAFARSRRTCQA